MILFAITKLKESHTNIKAEIQIHPKETNLNSETGINYDQIPNEPTLPVGKSKILPFANQTEKPGSVPYYANKN